MTENIKGWDNQGETLYRKFTFTDFNEAFAFMAKVAEVADAMNHHPDWSNSYNSVEIKLSSHDEGRLTDKDYELAQKINTIKEGIGTN